MKLSVILSCKEPLYSDNAIRRIAYLEGEANLHPQNQLQP